MVGYVPDYFFITHQGVKKTEISGVSATRGSSLSFARWQLGEPTVAGERVVFIPLGSVQTLTSPLSLMRCR